ncbi:MAG: hypothetical protein RBT11_04815 [Desulfobacterales bacterium]|jgi:hypothetical protein|nr:hypothetical protein [Desulfobacterales bacterium]
MRFGHHEHGNAVVLVIGFLLLLIGLGGGGFFVYQTKLQKQQGPTKAALPHVNLTQDVIRFSFNTLPALYNNMLEIEREIALIHTELARLETLSSEYPQQKSIVHAEKVLWEKTLKDLFSVLQQIEKTIEPIYVAYSVNREKGEELMAANTPDLLSAAEEVIAAAKTETARIQIEAPKTFMQKLKAKLKK